MWLAEETVSSGGIAGIVIAALGAISAVVVAYLRRDRDDDEPEPDRTVVIQSAQPAIEAAASQAAESAAGIYRDELMRERREKDELQRKYDDLLERYQRLLPKSGGERD